MGSCAQENARSAPKSGLPMLLNFMIVYLPLQPPPDRKPEKPPPKSPREGVCRVAQIGLIVQMCRPALSDPLMILSGYILPNRARYVPQAPGQRNSIRAVVALSPLNRC